MREATRKTNVANSEKQNTLKNSRSGPRKIQNEISRYHKLKKDASKRVYDHG